MLAVELAHNSRQYMYIFNNQIQESIGSRPLHIHLHGGRGETVAETETVGLEQGSGTQLFGVSIPADHFALPEKYVINLANVQRGKPDVWCPRDRLSKDFNGDIRVLLLEYSISENGVEGLVEELQKPLAFSDGWSREHTWSRPIVLVGHSLGCMVIEQLVVALNIRAKLIGSLENDVEANRAKIAELSSQTWPDASSTLRFTQDWYPLRIRSSTSSEALATRVVSSPILV